jgi:transcriptional regulator with GAF, ATPase, and Fis domain
VDGELAEFRARSEGTNGRRRSAEASDVREQARQFESCGIVTQSPLMVDVLEMVRKAARSRFCILIQGETGTGKELLARAIHQMGGLPPERFVAQNCNGIPEGLQESELFGHKKGAFTGAYSDKQGLFEIADGGTLFLDEVTDLTAGAQGKILRIIEDGELRRVGDVRSRRIRVRILAATNKPAIDEVRAGRFRKDLFYRLSVFPVSLPPLRERPEDIPLLAQYFLARESAADRKPVSFAPDALDALAQYEWPGNVRELENLLCRLYVLAEPGFAIRAHDLPTELLVRPSHPASAFGLKERVEMFERDQIERALREAGGDKDRTAAALGITRRWLSEKIRRYGLDRSGTIVPQ